MDANTLYILLAVGILFFSIVSSISGAIYSSYYSTPHVVAGKSPVVASNTPITTKEPIAVAANTFYNITMKDNTGFCVELPGGNTDDNTKIQLYACNNTPTQKWVYNKDTKEIKNNNKCIDIQGGIITNETPLQLYTCNGSNAQKWDFVNNSFKSNGKCMDIKGGVISNDSALQIYDCNDSPAQKFNLKVI